MKCFVCKKETKCECRYRKTSYIEYDYCICATCFLSFSSSIAVKSDKGISINVSTFKELTNNFTELFTVCNFRALHKAGCWEFEDLDNDSINRMIVSLSI